MSSPLVSVNNGNDVWESRPLPKKVWTRTMDEAMRLGGMASSIYKNLQMPDVATRPVGTPEQYEIRMSLRELDIYSTIEEEKILQAQCAIHGHVWPRKHFPSAADPLAQVEHAANIGDPCYFCMAPRP